MSGPFGSTAWMANPSSGFYNFEISNSLRFNDDDSAYLTRTPGSAGNLRTWTWSAWVKRTSLGESVATRDQLFEVVASANTLFQFGFVDDGIDIYDIIGSTDYGIKVPEKFRDTSAWYHVVLAWNTTLADGAGARVKFYVNNIERSSIDLAGAFPQNYDGNVNTAEPHSLGKYTDQSSFSDFYMTEVNFIDGSALTPSSFGETKNDIWIPKDTAGLTFGNQGWRLQFKQIGTGTASTSTIGADTSGNNNHWTSSGLTASDVTTDSPTNNFATWNPNLPNTTISAFEEGNTTVTFTGGGSGTAVATFGLVAGKWYWETKIITTGNGVAVGIVGENVAVDAWVNIVDGVVYISGGDTNIDGTEANFGASFTDNDIISCQLDLDSGTSTIEFFKNGASQGSKNLTSGKMYFPAFSDGSGVTLGKGQLNTGNPAFSISSGNADGNGFGNFEYAPASGFLAICTANLPDPVETIDPAKGGSPKDYFDIVLYTASDANGTYTHGDLEFQPDWSWLKCRSDAERNFVADVVRDNTSITDKWLVPDSTAAEGVNSTTGTTFSVTPTGYQFIESSIGNDELYFNSRDYVGWNWKAETAFSNDASSTSVGSIDSSGSVNTDVGFSIIKWTAVASSATQTMAHGLGAVPKMIIMKNRERAVDWAVYHEGLGNTHGMSLNTTASSSDDSGWWNDTTPTATVFTTGNGNGYRTGGVAEDYIAYCFANVDGYSKFGSYVGNGNADGPFIYTGFRPAWILIKETGGSGYWIIADTKRSPENPTDILLFANDNSADFTQGSALDNDIVSNGFKVRTSNNSHNTSGGTYIYMAFAEQPFKYSNAR